jgi:hypothetical protein
MYVDNGRFGALGSFSFFFLAWGEPEFVFAFFFAGFFFLPPPPSESESESLSEED